MIVNNILELKGKRFFQESKKPGGGDITMNGKKIVNIDNITTLINQLYSIKDFWISENQPFKGALISVYYNKIIAKSNRISGLLKGDKSNLSVVGVKFNDNKTKHIITYFIDISDINKSIQILNICKKILEFEFNGKISSNIFKDKNTLDKINFDLYKITKSKFKKVIADVSYIDSFFVETASPEIEQSIITLYDVGVNIKQVLENLGINILSNKILDDHTVFLDELQLEVLLNKAPYLISMSTVDLSKLSPEDFSKNEPQDIITIPSPTIEPTIGVIDTLFDERVYFNEWVEYHDMTDKTIDRTQEDYNHGTCVSSIIVDGPRLNPWLDDNCGRFKVRHFGVALKNNFSSFSIIKHIKDIIHSNKDIRVWNLSLGSNKEINDNFISSEAATLDKLQYENNIIFVIAGTNKNKDDILKIGSPADSINGIVVNSVTRSGLSAKYSRRGPVLSFFSKPDISYYGGSDEHYIIACGPLGGYPVTGTSFAAPWIARKLSYLIDILGMSREVAKALIIDSARGWDNPTPSEMELYGHGIVPIKIDDILKTEPKEIKFLISDISEKWNTYNYSFPVPLYENKYPYITRATMCYFTSCNKIQGIDYTNTELNLHFGRIRDDNTLAEINKDKQNKNDNSEYYLYEHEARRLYRKWDNVKCISEIPKIKNRAKKSYKNKNWGIEVKTNNRLNPNDGKNIKFGIVVTLRAIDNINRIEEFIKNCHLSGWIVNIIDIKNKIDIYQKANEEIKFE